jgi:hypothetical protein
LTFCYPVPDYSLLSCKTKELVIRFIYVFLYRQNIHDIIFVKRYNINVGHILRQPLSYVDHFDVQKIM